jgi:hypothetical protein
MAALVNFFASLLLGASNATPCASLPSTNDSREHIADLFNYDKAEDSAATLLDLADRAIQCGDLELAAQALTQAARAQGISDKLASANSTLERAAQLAASPETKIRITLEQGRLARREGNKGKAKVLLTGAFNSAMTSDWDALAADAAHMLAIITEGAESDKWTSRGLAIAEASEDGTARRWVGNLAFNAGVRLAEAGDHKMAALMFARSLAARELQNDPELIGTTELALSVELSEIGMLEEARAIQSRLLREHRGNEGLVAQVKQELERTAGQRAPTLR